MRTLQIPHSEQNVAAHNVTRSHSLEHITRFLSSLSILSHLHISLIFCTLPLLSILWDPPLILLSLYYPLAIIGFSASIWLATCLWISPPHHIYNIDFFSVFKVSLKRHLFKLAYSIWCCFFLNSILYWLILCILWFWYSIACKVSFSAPKRSECGRSYQKDFKNDKHMDPTDSQLFSSHRNDFNFCY